MPSGKPDWSGAGLGGLLVIVAAIQEGGVVGAAVANGLSLALMLAGVVWAVRGTGKLRRLSELYLWLAFVLSLSLLVKLSDAVARGIGTDELATFQTVAVAHVMVVAAALWVLGAWSRGVAPLAAGLLVVGAAVFWVGARTFPGLTLSAVAENPGNHMWTSANFLLATLITLAGLCLLTLVLREAGDRTWSALGLLAFLFGAVFWVIHLTIRLTVIREAAEEFGRTASPPPWFDPWVDWAGLLFGIFSVLAYLAIAAYGGALLRTGLLARGAAWSCVVVGLLAAPLFGPPLFIHVPFWVIGLLVLQSVSDQPDSSSASSRTSVSG